MICQSCGERFIYGERDKWPHRIPANKVKIAATHCDECALELLFGLVNTTPARTYPSGAGCPLEPNDDDASPWQENAIRDLED